MKENAPDPKDETLSKLLQTWKPDGQLPSRFQEAVWQRIQRADADVRIPFWQWLRVRIEVALARPALAVSYVAILLFAGLGAGYWQAEGKTTHAVSEWRARYVQTVDPYQMPR